MDRQEQNRAEAATWVRFTALGLGLGRSPQMPGTVGTLLGIPLVFCFANWVAWATWWQLCWP